MKSAKRRGAVPLSVESVRRRIMTVIRAVERETAQFLDRYSGNVGTPTAWPRYIDTVCQLASKTTYRSMTDFKDLEPVLQKIKTDDQLAKRTEYDELRRLVERGKLFDYIAFSLRNDLVSTFDSQLQKYCLSFQEEARGEDLQSVAEYQQTIDECRSQTKDKLAHVDHLLDGVDKHKKSLPQYVDNYQAVIELMEEACRAMVEACEPLKRWVSADAKYPRLIQEEISRYNKRKMDLNDVVKQLEDQRDAHAQKVRRTTNQMIKLEVLLKEARERKAEFRRRETDIEQCYTKTEAEIQRKKNDIEEIKQRIKSRQENSPANYNYLVGMTEALRSECRALEEKQSLMDTQIRSLHKDEAKAQQHIDSVASDLESSRQSHGAALQRMHEHEEQIRLVCQDIGRQDHRIQCLKQIREVKLHSDTVRKIHQHGYSPEELMEEQDQVRTAFHITGQEVGKDWVWLYQQLRFVPPRDYKQREQDTEIIDLNHWRIDSSYPLLCVKALEKWYRQSEVASIDELLAALRRMRRYKTIERIHRALSTGNLKPETHIGPLLSSRSALSARHFSDPSYSVRTSTSPQQTTLT